MDSFFLIILGLFGLAAGSFCTVLISRLGSANSVIFGRSLCPHCAKELRWFELFPVFSFLWQKGRCRSCRKPISFLYPAVELTTALLFIVFGWGVIEGLIAVPPFLAAASEVLTAGGWQFFAVLFYYFFFALIAVAVSFYDIIRQLVPTVLIAALALVGLGIQIMGAAVSGNFRVLILSAAAAAAGFIFFWSLWFFSGGRAMGRGDADAVLAITLYLGPRTSFLGFFLAFWIGALIGIMLMAAGKLGWKSHIPFTPFLFLGAVMALFASENIAMVNLIEYAF